MSESRFRVSWSMLQNYEKCSQRAKLIREGKRNKSADIRMYFPGTVVDRVMREWLNDPAPGRMPGMVRAMIDQEEKAARENGDGFVKWKHSGDKAAVEAFCIELVEQLEPLLQRLVLPHEYQPARRFWTPIKIPDLHGNPVEIVLNGETDLLCRDSKDQWAIWDLKATKNNSYWRKTLGQLVFYDLAHYAEFQVFPTVVGLIQPLCKQPFVPYQVTDQQRAEMIQRIMAYAHSVWRKEFSPREDVKECTACPVRRSCPKWKPVNPGGASPFGSVRGL